MNFISGYIKNKLDNSEKILSVFLTSGFPDLNSFPVLAEGILNSGADILEIGIPFSDPLADGPTIQASSQLALNNGANIEKTLDFVRQLRKATDKPIILMGYANPIFKYGREKFAKDCTDAGVNGVILPDIPLEEYEDFYQSYFKDLEVILLATPTTRVERLIKIDEISQGFVYYVSMTATTGKKFISDSTTLEPLIKASRAIRKNLMLVGFGISSQQDAKAVIPYCSGVIVGSAIIKSIKEFKGNYSKTFDLVRSIKSAINQL
jgi:tryptophan synthase alpha chain